MSFGTEFRNMRNQGGAPKPNETAVSEASAEAAAKDAEAPQASSDPDTEVYANPLVDGYVMGDPQPNQDPDHPLTIPPPKAEAKKVGVKINGKYFETVEEATDYAASLERELEKKEAVEKYIESTKTKTDIKPAEKKKIQLIADKIFENPEATFEELESYILEMVDKRAEARDSQKSEAQKQAEQMKADVDNFYAQHADLVDWQDEVNLVVSRNSAALTGLPKEQIASEVARLSRAYVASIKERALPRQTLPSKTVTTPGQGLKSTTATPTTATKKDVSFASQIRSTNRRTVMQDEV